MVATLSGNSLRQTVYTHRASVRQAAKLVAAFLRVATLSCNKLLTPTVPLCQAAKLVAVLLRVAGVQPTFLKTYQNPPHFCRHFPSASTMNSRPRLPSAAWGDPITDTFNRLCPTFEIFLSLLLLIPAMSCWSHCETLRQSMHSRMIFKHS